MRRLAPVLAGLVTLGVVALQLDLPALWQPTDWANAGLAWVRGITDPWQQGAVIAVSTFISEDLTCLASGIIARGPELGLFTAMLACALGIWLGDLGLYLIGAGARRQLGWSGTTWQERFARHGGWLILASRFMPGARLPLYTAIGATGGRFLLFAGWSALAVALWTPVIVGAAFWFGAPAVRWLEARGAGAAWAMAGVVVTGVVLLRLLLSCISSDGRMRWRVRLIRWTHHEFWPAWLFYLPLVPWFAWLSIRYRGVMTFTAANPAMPHGGVVGESKSAIQQLLPSEWALTGTLIAGDRPQARLAALITWMQAEGVGWPIILKPDAGQRGDGVRYVRDASMALTVLTNMPEPLFAQRFHPGPGEAGIFYYRMPGGERGRIFSLTLKEFPAVIGDGQSSLGQLVSTHPRYRLQLPVFAARHAQRWETVPASGERVALAVAGNHCQGTIFRDGSASITPALEELIEAIASRIPGFDIGRFDVRFASLEGFMAGEDLAIVEVNGVTSESTNIYDPAWSLWQSYRVLFGQWALLFRVGAANRARGIAPSSMLTVARDMVTFYRQRGPARLAD